MRAIAGSDGYDYLVSQPAAFERDPKRRWPLILFLHGAGERGSSLHDIKRHGLPKLLSPESELTAVEREVARKVSANFVVVSPQCEQYEVWNDDAVLRLLDDVSARFRIDPARVYLTGMSMGGFGAWSIGLRHPRRFAALVPICGGGRVADITAAAEADPERLRTLGVWAFHGALDRVVPLEESQRMIDALRAAGVPDVKFTIYPECEHDSWSASYANAEVYNWLLQHAR